MVVALVGYFFFKSMNNAKVAPENIRLGDEFLAQNASEEGVQTTASGLQYKVLQPGTGTEHPSASSKVRVHYHGTLLDGTVFDSSVERGEPIEFKLTQVIPGWTEGLQYMVVGEKTRLYIPAKLGYGNRSAGAIQPGSLLIFDVELLAIK
ncbi:FKBP-type peptidyl-prolyl cis-trans isomerase [Ferrimonas sediminum]|nr:FKBP-type peptidyl-prolyl cis-trans isomerase [Ferrimonas sediminum]